MQPYTECSMGMVPQQLNRTKLAPKLFVEKSCETGTKTVPHVKMVPHCKNVTKQNCVTNWETDKYGKQVALDSLDVDMRHILLLIFPGVGWN